MTALAQSLLQQVLDLPEPDLRLIVTGLLESLDSSDADSPADIDSAWSAEADRRNQEVRDGTAVLEDWDDVLADLRGRSKVRP